MSRDEQLYLDNIEYACEKILRFTESAKLEEFSQDEKTFDAVIRNLEIIGEAAKNLSEDICKKIPDIEWKKIKGLRNIIAHQYFGIDIEVIWSIVQQKIPHLLEAVLKPKI